MATRTSCTLRIKNVGTVMRFSSLTISGSGEFGAHGAAGGIMSKKPKANFRRLPFYCCALSLQPFEHPVCSPNGTVFDLLNIIPYLKKYGTNPVTGQKLQADQLVKLNFFKNEHGELSSMTEYSVLTIR